jgi:hypothetical protein
MLGHVKVSIMKRKRDVNGLIRFLSENINKNDADSGRAVMALIKIGVPSVFAIRNILPSLKNEFLKFTLIRILYRIGDKSCKDALVNEIKNFFAKNKPKLDSTDSRDKASVYYISVKTLKHLGINPKDWGLSNESYYDKIRRDYENSES